MSFILNCEPLSNSVWVTIEFFLVLHDYKYPTENIISTLSRDVNRSTRGMCTVLSSTLFPSILRAVSYITYIRIETYPKRINFYLKESPSYWNVLYRVWVHFLSSLRQMTWNDKSYISVLRSLTIYQSFCILSLYTISFNQSRVSFPIHS